MADNCIVNVPLDSYNNNWIIPSIDEENKIYSMSIRVSGEELTKLRLCDYSCILHLANLFGE